ncbi:toxin VasX [Cupriavidus sp. WS]|uniref:toxin VasX n=1 Tax=Cupriavidus sp. WS TaxID=1312922 RepID=UPI00039FC42F|nr:toxin VasX [Cupriavidus sp. WS]
MTSPAFKQALQPDNPCAKTLNAISSPPCEHGVPLYPLRYGIATQAYSASVFATLSVEGYPGLQSNMAYGLRVLRPGSYVYLFYFQDGRMKTRHYLVTEDVRFAHLWWTEADYNDEAPGSRVRPDVTKATTYLLAPESSVAQTVYVMVSDTILTHATLWKIEQDTDGLRKRLATEVRPAGGPEQKNAFNAVLLGTATRELLSPGFYGQPRHFPWSEIKLPNNMADFNFIFGELHRALAPRKDVIPLAVVLHDFIGLASELNHLCATEVGKRDHYQATNKHRLQSAALITSYFKQAESGAKTPDMREAIERQRKLVDLKGAQGFKSLYEQKLKTFEDPIAKTGADVAVWVGLMTQTGLVGKALSLFDLSCAGNARDYEQAVLNCLATTPSTDAGIQALTKHIEANPAISPLWRALSAGDMSLEKRLTNSLSIAKGVFDMVDKMLDERPGTIVTDLLTRLLWPYLAKGSKQLAEVQVRRLRHVGERRFGIVVGHRDVPGEQYTGWALELQGYTEMGDIQKRWNIHLDEAPGPLPGTRQRSVTEYVEVWEWETVASTTVTGQPRPMPAEGNPLLRNLKRMQGPAGAVFTGIGAGLAIWGVRNATEARKTDKSIITATSLMGSVFALISTSIEVWALAASWRASSKGNAVLARSIRIFGVKWGTTVLGAGAAAVLALTDGFRAAQANQDGNPEQAALYLGAALAGGVAAFATAAGGAAAVASLTGAAAPVWTLGITPFGWAAIIVAFSGLAIYMSIKSEDAEHGPMEVLLKYSAWGRYTPRYSLPGEMTAWHSLLYSPQISAKWEQAHGSVGTLRLRCTLPSSVFGRTDFRTILQVRLKGKTLSQFRAEDALAKPGTEINLDTHYVIAPLTDGVGVERGWRIGMHEDAQVELQYLYRPDVESRPTLALEQPDAPNPLVFTSSGWFSKTIDPAKLSPVTKPK